LKEKNIGLCVHTVLFDIEHVVYVALFSGFHI